MARGTVRTASIRTASAAISRLALVCLVSAASTHSKEAAQITGDANDCLQRLATGSKDLPPVYVCR